MGILSPECAPPVPSAHFPPHYTALSMSVASYASICTHVTIAVTTIATVTFVSTFIVCTHYKGEKSASIHEDSRTEEALFYPQAGETTFPTEGMLHSCIHMNYSVVKNHSIFP